MDQLIKMVIRQLTRQLVNKGISAGIHAASNRREKPKGSSPEPDAKRAKQAIRLLRRTARF